jgi:transposase-like protein
VHKTANVLNKLPKGAQAKAKQHLHAIWMAETREAAEAAFDHFVDVYGAKYDKAATCLVKDREPLLAFYDFPAEHWKHVRTTNPVESTRPSAHHQDQGLPVTPDGADHGLPALPERAAPLAAAGRPDPPRRSHPRRPLRRR